MAEGDWRIFHHLLECTICTEDMTVARVLPCGHSFCHKCLEQCLQHRVQNGKLPCPTCRAPYNVTNAGVTGIPQNVFVNKFLEATREQGESTHEPSHGDPGVNPQCSIEDCSRSAVSYCINCEEYMCNKCEGPHRVNKYTKKHKTLPSDQVKHSILPPCPVHRHMYLDLYCEDCSIAMCATCDRLDHKDHTCVNINTKNQQFKSQLDQVLTQTDKYLRAVKKAIHITEKEAIKVKADVDDLKNQTSAGYEAIIQHVKKQQQKQIEEIDNAYKRVKKIISEKLDTHETAEATLESIQLYGNHLNQKGTVYDLMTNVKGLIDRCEKSGKDCSKIKTLNCEVKVDWGECGVDVKGVRLIEGGGDTGVTVGNDQKITTFPTQWLSNGISGIVAFHNHLMVVHHHHDVIYVYDDMMRLKTSVNVPGMRYPWGLCLVEGGAATQHLVVSDCDGRCLWWLRLESQAGQVRLGQPIKHNLEYQPWSAVTDINGHALVSDYYNRRLYIYCQPVQTGACVQLPQDVKPQSAVSDQSGGYLIRDQGNELVWMASGGQVTRRYNDQPDVSAYHMVHRGTDWLVADSDNHCIHVVTGEGRHAGHLVTGQEGGENPWGISVDTDHHCVWVGNTDHHGKHKMIKVEYSPPHITTLTLCATLPRTHT